MVDAEPETEDSTEYSMFFWWVCGIILLVTALLISARMGIYQELLYKRYGKYPREALYVTVTHSLHLKNQYFCI